MTLSQVEAKISVGIVLIFLLALGYSYYSFHGFLQDHLDTAVLFDKGQKFLAYPGCPLLVSALHRLSGLPIREAFNILLSLHVAFTFAALYYALGLLDAKRWTSYACIIIALSLMVVAPIGLPGISPRVYSFDHANRSTALWRNTSHTVVQPYLILAFTYFCIVIQRYLKTERLEKGTLAMAGITLFLSALMKPCFAMTFIPTLGLFALAGRYPFRLKRLLVYLAVPTVLLMVIQYYLLFIGNPLNRTMSYGLITPLAVWKYNNVNPPLALLLSIVFPLYVAVMRWQKLQLPMRLAGLNFIIACVPYALLDVGDRDFEWGYWYGLQLLFLTAVIEWHRWWQEKAASPRPRMERPEVAKLLFMLHVLFGLTRFVLLYQSG